MIAFDKQYKPTGEIDDIVVLESKFTSRGKASLSWLPRTKEHLRMQQMSKDWVKWNIDNLLDSPNGALQSTGEILQRNLNKVSRKINVLDVSGTDIVNNWNKIRLPE